MRLRDRVAIITGAAQGIGRAYALRFAREGARVVVADLREEQAEAVAAECRTAGTDALAVRVDVSDEASTKALAARVADRFGQIDVLINNAAIYYDLDREQSSLEYFNRVLSVNLTGCWLMSRAVEPYMKRRRCGKIIHQSSTAAYLGNVGMVDTEDPDKPMPPFHYSVAKAGVSGLTKYMAGALGPWGINVNAIAPGVTMTEATKKVVPEGMLSMLVMYTALRRALEPEDLTGTAVFLASDDSNLMTGQVLVVDAGMIMLGWRLAVRARSPRGDGPRRWRRDAEHSVAVDVLMNNGRRSTTTRSRGENSLAYFNKIAVREPDRHDGSRRPRGRALHERLAPREDHPSTSTAALMGNVGMVDTESPDKPMPPFHYSVAKQGVGGLTKYMAGALGPGINVNANAPGVTMTEATKKVVPAEMATRPAERDAQRLSRKT